jgi:hypothetical protein
VPGSSTPAPDGAGGLDALARDLQELQAGGTQMVGLFARSENFRHVRHEQVLARWPILDESWARNVEAIRKGAIDRTPGAATFGR